MPLTDVSIKTAKPTAKPIKLYDEGGLYLLVNPTGSKLWRLKYRFGGKEKLLALGTYPQISLKEARAGRDSARKLLGQDIDPSAHRKVTKMMVTSGGEDSLEVVAREWFSKFSPAWAPTHSSIIMQRLEKDVFPWLGGKSIGEVEAPELLLVLQRVEGRGAIETAHRIKQVCGQVFRYAIATGRAKRDPAADLKGALPSPKQRHFAAMTNPKQIGDLLRALHGYKGSFPVACALKLAPLVFVRPGELRAAEWSEFDLGKAEWRIPGAKMKVGEQHLVPLSRQALAVLAELQPLTGRGQYLFPSERTPTRCMSNNTVNAALRRMGFTKEEITGHGFRSMASTLLNEQGWNRDAIERQLAHAERDAIRAAYNFAEHLPIRRQMMQAWADYLDALRGP